MEYYLIIAFTFVVFAVLHLYVLPVMFLTARGIPSNDRAVMDVAEKDGRSIICTAGGGYDKYVKHYVISRRGDKKLFRCEVDKSLRYIEYDIRMFNSRGRMFKIYTVKEVLDGSGIAPDTVELDGRTAYVNVIVRVVDDKKLPYDKARKLPSGGLFMYFLLSTVVEVVCAFTVKICVAQLYGGENRQSFLLSEQSTLITAAVCVVMVVLNIVITGVSLKKYTKGKAVKLRGKHA